MFTIDLFSFRFIFRDTKNITSTTFQMKQNNHCMKLHNLTIILLLLWSVTQVVNSQYTKIKGCGTAYKVRSSLHAIHK